MPITRWSVAATTVIATTVRRRFIANPVSPNDRLGRFLIEARLSSKVHQTFDRAQNR